MTHPFTLTPLALAVSTVALTISGATWGMHETVVEVSVPLEQQSAFSVTPAQALSELQRTAGGVTVVDAQHYLTGRAGTMEDTLKLATGVFIQSRFGADEARVSIRGSGLQRTFHGRGLMLLQDGVPLNLADGGFDMQAIEPQATRYIEVERGANALRYGSSTLGGAINYVSQTGRTSPPLVLRAEAGSFDYQRYQASVAGQQGSADGYASFNFTEQAGFRDHARQRNQRLVGNVGWQLSPQIESRFYVTAVDTDSELPGNLTYAQLKANPRKADALSVNRDAKRDFALYRLANRTAITHDDNSQTEVTSYAAKKYLFHPLGFARIEQENRDLGLGFRHSRNSQWLGMTQSHVLGANWRRGLTVDEQCTYGGAPATTHPCTTKTKSNKLTANNLELYGESRWAFTPATTVSLGGQWTDAQRKVASGDVPLGPFYDQDYRRFSPKLGVLHHLTASLDVYANVSASYEPPSFSETTAGATFNQAQRAKTYELGARAATFFKGAQLSYDVSVYRAQLRNELLALTQNGTQTLTVNADKTVHQGVEAGLLAEAEQWRGQASYLYNDFKFQRDAQFGNHRIAGLPDQVLSAEFALRLPKQMWLGPTLRAASRAWVDHANTLAAPGYSVFGVKLNQTLSPGLSWFVEGRNLGDMRYAATTGVMRNAGGNDQAQFAPGEGRAVYVGASKAF